MNSSLNPPYASSSSVNWKKIVFEIVKFAVGAILGGLGVVTFDGCVCVPVIG